MYATKNANQYEGDVVIQEGSTVYVCKLMPGYARTANDLPVTQQPIWQIQRATLREIPANDEHDTLLITELMYPNGNEAYQFVMEDFLKYNYDFRH